MKKNVNPSVVTVNPSTLNYPHPYFVPIDDGDEETIKFYKRNDVQVAHIALPGRMKHYYAVFNADTQEYADLMNRTYNNWEKKAARAKASQEEYESSYDVMVENGYDAKDDTNNPEEIIAYKTVINALNIYEEEKKRQAQIYVFCVQAETDQDKVNVLDTAQWKFYVLSSKALNESKHYADAGSIGLSALINLGAVECKYEDLHKEVIKQAK